MADINLLEETLDIAKLKVPDLKKELKIRGLSVSGNKGDLIDRLRNSLKSKHFDVTESVDDLDDDLLNDDDLDHDHLDTSESVLTELDEQFDVSPTTKNAKRKISDNESSSSESKPAKKIVLNRNSSVIESSNLDNQNDNLEKTVDDSINELEEKKTIKLSELSSKERLEMRAKKFGAPTTDAAKKVARAQRFSLSTDSSTSPSSTTITEGSATPALDALKKRAERFGGSVSTAVSSLEQQERIEKRKARFGAVTTTNGTSQDDKAKKRLERFKTPIK